MDFDALLVGLLENVSFSRQEGDATAYLVAQMAALGYDQAFIDAAGNAVGTLGTGEREIVLLGHIDTVPGVIPVKVIDDQLYGRGAVDAKGPLAAFTAGAIKAGAQTGWKIIVIGAVEEEAATSKGARYVATQYHPSLCVIGEPSSWDRVTLGYKGRALLECRVSRPISIRRALKPTRSSKPSPFGMQSKRIVTCLIKVANELSSKSWYRCAPCDLQKMALPKVPI